MHIVKVVGVILWTMCFSGNPVPDRFHQQISWFTLQEAEIVFKKERKPILIDLYTNWCGWCKVMDKKTYADQNVIRYIQEKYIPVKLDAETKASIKWNGNTYTFNALYHANDIAVYLTDGRLSYPTTIIIPADGSAQQAIPGYLRPKEMELLLSYFGEQQYGKISFEEYRKQFKPSWK